MSRSRKIIAGAVATVAVLASIAVGAIVAQPGGCQPDPAAAIAAVPAGGTWTGSGCYTTTGILLTKPITLNGGTFNDPITAATAAPIKPIIRVKDTSGVTVENVSLNGTNTAGGYHGDPSVGEAGISVISSSHVTLTNVATANTFGDGLTLGFQPRSAPSSDVTVTGYTVTNAGRQGVTIAYATASTFTDVNLVSSADAGWDFESDLPQVGSGNITINRPSGNKGIRIVENITGPITVNDSNFSGHVSVQREAANGQTVSFVGGIIQLPRSNSGNVPAGVFVSGPGSLAFTGVNLSRQPGTRPPSGLAWSATAGGHLSFTHCSIAAPLGTSDSTSTVLVNP